MYIITIDTLSLHCNNLCLCMYIWGVCEVNILKCFFLKLWLTMPVKTLQLYSLCVLPVLSIDTCLYYPSTEWQRLRRAWAIGDRAVLRKRRREAEKSTLLYNNNTAMTAVHLCRWKNCGWNQMAYRTKAEYYLLSNFKWIFCQWDSQETQKKGKIPTGRCEIWDWHKEASFKCRLFLKKVIRV